MFRPGLVRTAAIIHLYFTVVKLDSWSVIRSVYIREVSLSRTEVAARVRSTVDGLTFDVCRGV